MAVVAAIGVPAAAINYTQITDTSADFTSVANSTYFYNKTDKIVRFKDATGTVLEIFAASGGGGSILKLTAQTLTVASWSLSSGYYVYNFSNANINANTRVDFTPDNASYNEVTTCGMTTQVDVSAGVCRFYSIFPPQSNITGEITIFPTL